MCEGKVKSLQKALDVLNCFTEKQPLGVTEISEKLGLYKSNVHNILMTFKAMDYLEQNSETGKFQLGSAILSLSYALQESLTISNVAVPIMKRIAQETGEVVYLAIPRGDEVIYLEAAYPPNQPTRGRAIAGERAKMFCTSVGKAILSKMSDDEVDLILSEEKEIYTDYTITDKTQLWDEVLKAREDGYAFDNMENTYGVKCVGVPILNREGGIEGAMSISAPSLRMDDGKKEIFVESLKKHAIEIQKRL